MFPLLGSFDIDDNNDPSELEHRESKRMIDTASGSSTASLTRWLFPLKSDFSDTATLNECSNTKFPIASATVAVPFDRFTGGIEPFCNFGSLYQQQRLANASGSGQHYDIIGCDDDSQPPVGENDLELNNDDPLLSSAQTQFLSKDVAGLETVPFEAMQPNYMVSFPLFF